MISRRSDSEVFEKPEGTFAPAWDTLSDLEDRLPGPGQGRLWWGFGVLIAVPALVLAIVGLRAGALEESDREHQVEQQQRQTAQLADTLLSAAFSRVENDLRQRGQQPSGKELWFTFDRDGNLTFWNDRVYFAATGSGPREARTELPMSLQAAAEKALSAEAQGRDDEAVALFQQLAKQPELNAWARWSLIRISFRQGKQTHRDWTETLMRADPGARSPDGTPVQLAAATFAVNLKAQKGGVQSFLGSTLAQLHAGRWWLSHQQRKIYGAELNSALVRTGGISRSDSRLDHMTLVERLVRRTGPFRGDGATRLMTAQDGAPVLLVLIPEPNAVGGWRGTAFLEQELQAFIQGSLGSIRDVSYPIGVLDSSGGALWGETSVSGARAFPLMAVAGWQFRAGPARRSTTVSWRWRWYGVVAVLLTMLAFGIATTTRTVRRELELSRLKAEFAAGVTHEFKSPITGIRLLVERIGGGRILQADSVREYCGAIRKEADNLDLLVNRLLETHRIQSGQKRYNFAPHCATDIAESAIAHLGPHAEVKRIAITLTTDDPTREVELDRTAIHDAVENLLENAIKYSPPDTEISIRIRHSEGELSVTIKDQGIGIDPGDLSKVFEHFFRGRRSQDEAIRGTGLGLALVKATVEGHGGQIEVESKPGSGSEFRVRIPIRQKEAHAASVDRGR